MQLLTEYIWTVKVVGHDFPLRLKEVITDNALFL